MRSAVSARPASLLAGGLLALTSLLAGCAGGADWSGDATPSASASSTAGSTSSAPSGTASPTASASASPTASASTPSATLSSTPSPARLADRLLPATAVPGLRPGARWTPGTTGPESPSSSFGTCQRFSTLAIGAERALVRRYRPVGSAAGDPATADRAGELVAQLPDALTARRASAVLTAWRARCSDRLTRYRRHDLGAAQDVPVTGGSASWYLLTYGPVPCADRCPARLYADAQGMVVVGDRIAMVSLRTVGSAAAVSSAMPTALRSAARLLR